MSHTIPRKLFIALNFSSHFQRFPLNTHLSSLSSLTFPREKADICICAPFVHLGTTRILCAGVYEISSQDVSRYKEGPYTGEVSSKMLKGEGVDWSLIGEKYRREYYDSEEDIMEKLKRIFEEQMNAIVCVGDNAEDKEGNKSLEKIDMQMDNIYSVSKDNWDHLVICYQPMWQKDNESVDKEWIQQVHQHIRQYINSKLGAPYSKSTRIIYGGYVNSALSKELIVLNDVDGFLVGETSIGEEVKDIIDCVNLKEFKES